MKCEKTQERRRPRTLQVQVFGPGRRLRGDLGVDLDGVEVVGVSGDDHVVPVVVIQRLVGVAFDQVGSVPQVGHVVQITGMEGGEEGNVRKSETSFWKTGARKFSCVFHACVHDYQRPQLSQEEWKNCQELEKGFWAVLNRTSKLFDLQAI